MFQFDCFCTSTPSPHPTQRYASNPFSANLYPSAEEPYQSNSRSRLSPPSSPDPPSSPQASSPRPSPLEQGQSRRGTTTFTFLLFGISSLATLAYSVRAHRTINHLRSATHSANQEAAAWKKVALGLSKGKSSSGAASTTTRNLATTNTSPGSHPPYQGHQPWQSFEGPRFETRALFEQDAIYREMCDDALAAKRPTNRKVSSGLEIQRKKLGAARTARQRWSAATGLSASHEPASAPSEQDWVGDMSSALRESKFSFEKTRPLRRSPLLEFKEQAIHSRSNKGLEEDEEWIEFVAGCIFKDAAIPSKAICEIRRSESFRSFIEREMRSNRLLVKGLSQDVMAEILGYSSGDSAPSQRSESGDDEFPEGSFLATEFSTRPPTERVKPGCAAAAEREPFAEAEHYAGLHAQMLAEEESRRAEERLARSQAVPITFNKRPATLASERMRELEGQISLLESALVSAISSATAAHPRSSGGGKEHAVALQVDLQGLEERISRLSHWADETVKRLDGL
ncbi:hypothetical protein IE53DRAFT_384518 [Violaceomyces palustris]|uniref:Uncharacterized protein n=1 Tax=Violaceomyces palustris TaxID=1673888 RepID=A0ACD0P4J4_9BASI|nr:hypothetical protein IE53DRAFT_384518 [Violaceomyces palustris]